MEDRADWEALGFLAAGAILAVYGADNRYTINDIVLRLKRGMERVATSWHLARADTEQR